MKAHIMAVGWGDVGQEVGSHGAGTSAWQTLSRKEGAEKG